MKKSFESICVLFAVSCLAIALVSCGGKNNLSRLDSRELFVKGKEKYDKGKYLGAIEYFQTIVYNFPGESLVDTAQHYLAMSYFNNDDFELARVEFNRLAINYPSSRFFQHALFMKAASAYESTPNHYGLDQTELKTAIDELEDFLIDYPESEHRAEALHFLDRARQRLAHKYYESGVTYLRIGAYDAAAIYFQKVIDDYTSSEYAADAMFLFGRARYKQKKYDEAFQKFVNFPAVFPGHKLIAEAEKMASESAFQSAEEDFEKQDYASAREKLETFKKNFPDSKRIDRVNDYLQRCGTAGSGSVEKADAGS